MKSVTVDFLHSLGTINRNIYGHFAEHIGGVINDGLWVGEDSKVENIGGFRKALVDSFKKIAPPVVRWPGGCFAETYDWRDGIGPREKRPRRINWWYHHDKRVETNQVGTHEFMQFCRMVGAEPYFAANMTTMNPLHIRNWIEYCNIPAGVTDLSDERAANGDVEPFNVKYWGIGNENWGGGGQMSPEMCAREFIRYSTACTSVGIKDCKFIMCGPDGHDVQWTRRLMQEWVARPWQEVPTYGMSVHCYTKMHPFSDPRYFTEDEWNIAMTRAAYMRHVLDDHRAAMDEFDPQRRIKLIVDEWGCWHRSNSGPSEGFNLFEQQSNMRDAVVAALTLNIFNNRCDVVDMANVAQLCNNLHSLYLAGGENFVETPNYYVFDMYKGHQDARQLETIVGCGTILSEDKNPVDDLSASASIKDGTLTLTLANMTLTEQQVQLGAIGGKLSGKARLRVLSHEDPHTCNTFDDPYAVVPTDSEITIDDDFVLTLPGAGVAALTIRLDG